MNIFKGMASFISNIFSTIKNGTFLRDGLSIDETKVSAMIIIFLISTIFALFMYYLHGDITINLLNLLSYLIFGITGVNIVDKVTSRIGNNNTQTPNMNPNIQDTIESVVEDISKPIIDSTSKDDIIIP